MKHKLFLKNAAILTATSIILRTAGIFFRIWMSGAIGAEGMGLYQLIISVYVFASTFASGGISTAVTRMVAELPQKCSAARRILSRALTFTLFIATVSGGLIYILAEPTAKFLLCDARSVSAIKTLTFGLPFMGISAVLRGYFLAWRNTSLSGISQIVEQVVRMGLIIPLVGRVAHLGLTHSTAAILFGDVVAEGAGCLFLVSAYKWGRFYPSNKVGTPQPVTRKMLHIALPITAGRYIHTALRTAENLLVPARIALFGGNREAALGQFGMLKGMAIPLLFFPASFLNAFSTLMIPEISESLSRGRMHRVRTATEKSIGVTVTVSTLLGGIFFLCGKDLSILLYGDTATGHLITALSPLVPFMYLESVCDGILKGLDQQGHSFIYGLLDSVSRIVLILIFLDDFGMTGFLGIMVYSNLLTSTLNLRRLLKVTDTPIKYKSWIFHPLLFVTVGGALGFLAMSTAASPLMRVALGGGTTASVYLALMFITGELRVLEGVF